MTPSFVIPAAGNGSPESVSRKRRMAEAMLAQSMGAEPISSPWQGAAKLAQALMGGLATARADSTEKQGREAANQALIRALTGDAGVAPSQSDPTGAMVEGMNNPWQSDMGQRMLYDRWQQQNTPYQPDWKTFNQGNDVYRYDQNDPNAKPALFFDGPNDPPKPPPVTEQYDEKGNPRKMMWDEKTGTYVPFGGSKADSNGITIGPDGTVQIGGSGKMTEANSKDLNFYNRASQVAPMLDEMDNALTQWVGGNFGNTPMVGNYLKTDAYRQAEQMGREFLAPILRKDTGAAVTDGELAAYGGMYLPQPGDDEQTIKQKREARGRAVESLKLGIPPQMIFIQEQQFRKKDTKTPVGAVGSPELSPSTSPDIDALLQKYGGQ